MHLVEQHFHAAHGAVYVILHYAEHQGRNIHAILTLFPKAKVRSLTTTGSILSGHGTTYI